MKTYEPLTLDFTGDELTSSQAGSPAKTSASPARVRGWRGNAADYGSTCSGLFEKPDLVGASLRTYLLSIIGGLTRFSADWKRRDTPHGRSWWELMTWEHPIGASGCGSLLDAACSTPRCQDSLHNGAEPANQARSMLVVQVLQKWATPQAFDAVDLVRTEDHLAKTRAEKNAGCMNLREQVHYPQMTHSRKEWKTPCVPNGGRSPKGGMTETGVTPDGKKRQVDLNYQVKASAKPTPRSEAGGPHRGHPDSLQSAVSWPTPAARDFRNGQASEETMQRNSRPLNEVVTNWPTPWVSASNGPSQAEIDADNPKHRLETAVKGQLNPDWVTQLMGYPDGWLDIPFSAGRRDQGKNKKNGKHRE